MKLALPKICRQLDLSIEIAANFKAAPGVITPTILWNAIKVGTRIQYFKAAVGVANPAIPWNAITIGTENQSLKQPQMLSAQQSS